MKIPDLTLRNQFSGLYNDEYLQNIFFVQFQKDDEFFQKYPKNLQKKILPNDLKDKIKKRIEQNEYANILKEHKITQLVRNFSKENLSRPLLLKGAYLIRTLYKDCSGIRTMSDIDLLIKKKEYEKSFSLLKKYYKIELWEKRTHPFSSKYYHEYKIYAGKQLIEIHKSQHPIKMFDLNYEDFFKNSKIDSLTGSLLPTLEYMILFFLIHDLSQDIKNLTIKSITEMYIMLFNSDKEVLTKMVNKFNLNHLLNFYLFMIETLFENSSLTMSPKNSILFFLLKKDKPLFSFWGGRFCYKLFVYRKKILKKVFYKFFFFFVDKIFFCR